MNKTLETIALVFLGLTIGCLLTAFITPREYPKVIIGFAIAGAASFIIMIITFAFGERKEVKTQIVSKKACIRCGHDTEWVLVNTDTRLCPDCTIGEEIVW